MQTLFSELPQEFYTSLGRIPCFLKDINWYAVLLALLVPALLIWAKHEILLKRLRAILDFMLSFKLYKSADDKNSYYNPSFEFVKSKYISDIKISAGEQKSLDDLEYIDGEQNKNVEVDRLKIYIEYATWSGSRSNKRIYMAALGFSIASYYGFKAIFGAIDCNFSAISNCRENAGMINKQMLVIGGLAFTGAFVAAVRMLLRALALYDLTAYSFLRHTGEMIFSVLLVMLIYRAFPDPFFHFGKLLLSDSIVVQLSNIEAQQKVLEKQLEGQSTARDAKDDANPSASEEQAAGSVGSQEQDGDATSGGEDSSKNDPERAQVLPTQMGSTDKGIPWIWFAFAPVLGLLPVSASKFLIMKMQSLVSWTKTTDDRFIEVSKVISLDIIDGIDFETRFRLEECGIYDVQNLATYNPVMLHIETPYGIYQTIDWIAQAQLCHIVGHEKFLMFREINIRTIFDLERAIDSVHSPEAFDDIYASILFAPTDNLKKAATISQFKFLITDDDKAPRQASVDEFCVWARRKLREGGKPGDQVSADAQLTKAVEHLMAWISDDLHIRRLRRLWVDISESLGEKSEYFPDSKRLKARQDYIDSLCTQWVKDKDIAKTTAAQAESVAPSDQEVMNAEDPHSPSEDPSRSLPDDGSSSSAVDAASQEGTEPPADDPPPDDGGDMKNGGDVVADKNRNPEQSS